MCGIAGIISTSELSVQTVLPRMIAAQVHRGPDDCGQSVLRLGGCFVGLGHRRLSILDLSMAGHQPMAHPATGDLIIFNGEIYNFAVLREQLVQAGEQFRGHSDTEVLLHGLSRWGADFVARLQGMYAFAFVNIRERSLLLARDSVGIKPLYIAQMPDGLAFASEVRALLASEVISRRLDRGAIAGLLAYGAIQQPLTAFHEIRSFPAGTHQTIRIGDPPRLDPPVRFWKYPRPNLNAPAGDEIISQVAHTVESAVRDHLVSDVPVGVFLSSGIDSTVIAGLAAKHTPNLRSFTVAFADQPDMSEGGLARQTAEAFGLKHTEIVINNADAEAAAVDWLGSLDQPSIDGLNVYVISKAVRAQGIVVALSGQGGDELFGGYPSFRDVPRLHATLRRLAWVPGSALAALSRLISLTKSDAVREKLVDMAQTRGDLASLCLLRRRAMSNAQLAALGIAAAELGLDHNYLPLEASRGLFVDEADPVWSVSRMESEFYQGNMLLRDADVNGMAHSLELRVPLLDQRLLDLMLALPGSTRLPKGRPPKYLLRAAFPSLLRPALLNQAKRGFTLPIRRWMLGPLRGICEQALLDLKRAELLNQAGVDRIWQGFLNDPESPIWSRAFTLCVLGCYIRKMKATA